MSPHAKYASLVQRIADLVGIQRTRAADVQRAELNGTTVEAATQLQTSIHRLERVVRDLEKSIS